MKKSYIRSVTLIVGLFAALFLHLPTAGALSGADWRAGTIIDDSLFYDNNSMSLDQVQSFLNSKVPQCDTWGTKPASEFGYPSLTHAQYAQRVGWPAPPYICLKDYYQVPRSDTIINNFNAKAERPAGSISAAQIIKNAADNYGVSPKALLVLLHKESAGPLTVDSWPLEKQYKNAMGYACPDTAPCDPQYAGFYNQVTNAAMRIQTYKKYPNSYRHKPFAWNSTVYYNPNLNGCGSSAVYITGYATAGLYNYTPYQPNKAALDNLYGTGDSCSAYGNRNFWRIYSDWFGGSSQFYQDMIHEWYVAPTDIIKRDPTTGAAIPGSIIGAGTEIKVTSQIKTAQGEFYRTEYDTNYGLDKAIRSTELSKKPFINLDKPIWIKLKHDAFKQSPYTGYNVDSMFNAGTELKVTSKIEVNGLVSYRTEYDTAHNIIKTIPSSFVEEMKFVPFEEPRWMEMAKDSNFYDPFNKRVGEPVSQGQQFKFTSKLDMNSGSYARTEYNTNNNILESLDASAIKPIEYREVYTQPLNASFNTATKKVSPTKGTEWEGLIEPKSTMTISSLITVNGSVYVRSHYDSLYGYDKAVPIDSISVGEFSLMSEPRKMRLTKTVKKINPLTGEAHETIPAGTVFFFPTKYSNTENLYLRTEYDSVYNLNKAIPYSALERIQ